MRFGTIAQFGTPNKPVVLATHLNGNRPAPVVTPGQIKLYRETIRSFRGAERGALDFDEIEELMRPLDSMAVITMPLAFPQYWRGRKCRDGTRWNNVKSLMYPDPKVVDVGLGRVNLSGKAILYATNSSPAVFCECRADRGDIFQILTFRPKPQTTTLAVAVGALNAYFRSGQPMLGHSDMSEIATFFAEAYRNPQLEELVAKYILFDAFIGEQFGQIAGTDAEYKFTALIAEKLLKPPFEAIVYPSVAFPGATNTAILPEAFDTKFIPIGSALLRVKQPLGYGIWSSETLATSGEIRPNGDIVWMEAVDPIAENVLISCKQRFRPAPTGP